MKEFKQRVAMIAPLFTVLWVSLLRFKWEKFLANKARLFGLALEMEKYKMLENLKIKAPKFSLHQAQDMGKIGCWWWMMNLKNIREFELEKIL